MMVNTNSLLLILVALTVVVWLLQELIGRRQQQWAVAERIQGGAATAQHAAGEPAWSDWAFKIVLVLWLLWLARVVTQKDGDFALVLVMLTLLSGLIGGLDRFWFERRRRQLSANLQSASESLVAQRPIAEYSRSFFPVLAAVLVLRSFIAEPFQIPSKSMVPTLQVGDYILVNKFNYGLRLPVLKTKILDVGEPKRGDVVVFFPPGKDIYFIKRLIGLPGDHIQYRHKVLYINGQKAEQTFLANLPASAEDPPVELDSEQLGSVAHSIYKIVDSYNPTADEVDITVQPGHYFMMGDNRDNSLDSRFWGQVPEENIVGKAFAIWMHWEYFFSLPGFDRVGAIH